MKDIYAEIMGDILNRYGSIDDPNFHWLSLELGAGCDGDIISFLLHRFWLHDETDFNVDRGYVFYFYCQNNNQQYKFMISCVGRYACIFPVQVESDGTRFVGGGMSLVQVQNQEDIAPIAELLKSTNFLLLEDDILDEDIVFDGHNSTFYNVLFSED